jgi:nucleoside-triphosphatase THEP1
MHVFLTGLRGIGKTTIIARIVNNVVAGGIASADDIAGFRTVWMSSDTETASETLYIVPYEMANPVLPMHSAAKREPSIAPVLPVSACESSPAPTHIAAKREPSLASARPVAERDTANRALIVHPEVFDEDGVAILRAATESMTRRPKLIIMDELGFMESDARVFQKAVMDTLDGDIPILGVMRRERNPFLNEVSAHEKVETVEVDKANRDELPERLATQMFHA